ncbi:MAG: hypothetical protein JPMHGGIA_00927 [Saprospiraceae bacterium]|jgi:hypothetical protein|nr:hypothetical protein [Saprospiraceae bacterium]
MIGSGQCVVADLRQHAMTPREMQVSAVTTSKMEASDG